MEKTELQAITRCQDGDMQEFAYLYDAYVKRIYNFIYFRTGHKETAEDLTSLTFTKAFQKINTYKTQNGLFSGWLFRIARNNIIDHSRTAKPTLDLDAAVNAPTKDNVAGEAEIRDQVAMVKNYLMRLSVDQRDIVVMRLWDDLSYAEIAAQLGKTEGNCKVIFSRVLHKMQSDLLPALLYIFITINLF